MITNMHADAALDMEKHVWGLRGCDEILFCEQNEGAAKFEYYVLISILFLLTTSFEICPESFLQAFLGCPFGTLLKGTLQAPPFKVPFIKPLLKVSL